MSEYNRERKKITILDLGIGDRVVGEHVDQVHQRYNVVAGEIIRIEPTDSDSDSDSDVIYHVKGVTLHRPYADSLKFSGILMSNELESIDPGTYTTIMELFDLANKQIIAGISYQETVQKIRDIRQKSRQELEEKYPVVEAQ